MQARQCLPSNGSLHIAQRIAIDRECRGLTRHEDGKAPIATAGIGDKPGPRLVHPPVRFAKLDERMLIQMLVHVQMVQMVSYIIRIAGLRMDTIHLIVKLSQEMLGRHLTSKVFRPAPPPWARSCVPGCPTDGRCTRVHPARSGRGAALPRRLSALRPGGDAR